MRSRVVQPAGSSPGPILGLGSSLAPLRSSGERAPSRRSSREPRASPLRPSPRCADRRYGSRAAGSAGAAQGHVEAQQRGSSAGREGPSEEGGRGRDVSTRVKLASALIAVFCILNAVDAYTTEVGLADGGREINSISAAFIAQFGVGGYVLGKIMVSLFFAGVSIVVWRWWHRMDELIFDLYLVMSLALLMGATAAVLNNLIVLTRL